MKKLLSLFVPLLALMLLFVPQSAQATLDVATNLQEPLTIETTPAATSYIRFRRDWGSTGTTKVTINLQYRKQENGGSWSEWTTIAIKNTTTVAQLYSNAITLTAGTAYKIQFRGDNSTGFSTASVSGAGSSNNYNITLESSSYTWAATIYGNVMSLIVGYDTGNETAAKAALAAADEIPSDYCFAGLFYNNNSTSSTYPPATNAENLIFPAVYLRAGCYRNMFYQYNRSDNNFKGGLNEGPCFLATDWNNKSGAHVNNTFLNLFNQCVNLKSAHFSFTTCPTSDDFNAYSVYTTPDSKTLYAPAGFNPTSCTIGTWNHSTWSYDGNGSGGGSSPEPAEVDIFQSGFKRGYKLLYPLDPVTVDGITYTPVDLGTGIAWADRNIGANTTEDVGTLFYWGDTEGHTTFSSSQYYSGYSSMAANAYLPLNADAAHVKLGDNWRMPSLGEWAKFYNYSVPENGISGTQQDFGMTSSKEGNIVTVSSVYDPAQQIQFPVAKYNYLNENNYNSTNYPLLWTRQHGNSYGSNSSVFGLWSNNFGNVTYSSNTNYYGLPVRPVYVPTCETCTLNIGIQTQGRYCILYGNDGTCWEDQAGTITYWFRFICVKGQQVTVNPVGNPGYVFYQWKASNNSTVVNVPGNVFTVTENATYYATFREQYWNTTWNNYDGTQLAVTETRAGDIPEYTGSTPAKPAPGGVDWKYVHSGWTPAIVAATGDATYTATFAQGYTLSTETGGKGTVSLTAAGYPDRVGSGDYVTGTSVTMTATSNGGATFIRWEDTGSTNPVRVVTVNSNMTYTAIFGLESADATVDVYENVSANTTKILYDLSEKTGVDGNTYIPIDLGYGVAWADRNVGAISTDNVGKYFAWSDTNPNRSWPSGGTSYGAINQGNNSYTNGYTLTSNYDAAYVNMGSNWRIPTNTEWSNFLTNTTLAADGGTFENKSDNTKSIFLPTSGYYIRNGLDQPSYRYYWSSVMYKGTLKVGYSNKTVNGAYAFQNYGGSYYVDWYDHAGGSTNNAKYNYEFSTRYYGMPIRAIYVPSYTPCTLTVNIQGSSYSYKYLCQPGQTVTVTANATTEGYVFDKWTEDDDTQATRAFVVTSSITYTASFKEAPAVATYYDITIASNNTDYGTVSAGTINDVEENTVISTSGNTLTIGETIITATKTADDAQYTYAFTGWTDNSGNALPESVTADLAIRANFTQSKKQYTLTWDFDGGTTATADGDYTHGSVEWGIVITAPANPTKDGYTFTGWNVTPAATMPSADVIYTAQWESASAPIVLYDDRENSFYNTFKTTYDGATGVIVTYNRQFTQGRWSTLCLPFSVNKAMFNTLNFGSRIYEFKYATGNADDGVNLYFSIAKSIEAGKGYIVNADAKLAARTSFTFSGVTMDLSADNGAELNSVEAYDNLTNGCSTKDSNIELVGTLRKGTLKGTAADNRYMGLKENKIYYPNITTGSTILAYRGIFRSISGTLNAERIRIIVDGEDMGELRIDKGEMLIDSAEPRKFIENGVLYIERNGVIYDATGKRVELDK